MSWEMVKLGGVCEIIAGQSPESIYYNKEGEGKPFFQGKADFNEDYPSVRYFTSKVTKLAQKNDILLSVRAPVGPTNICNLEACIGRGLASIRVKENVYYKYVYFHFKAIEKKLSQTGNGSTFSAITTSDVKNIKIPLPPLSTQKRIAEILDKADALRKKDQQLLKYYDQLAQSLFIDLFGDPVKNEKGWEVKKLGEFTQLVSSGSTPLGGAKVYQKEGVYFIRSQNVLMNEISFDKISFINSKVHESMKRTWVEKNDVLLNITGASIGRVAVFNDDDSANVNQHVCIIRTHKEKLSPIFLSNLIAKDSFQKKSIANSAGGTREAFNFNQIKAFQIIIPPISLQNQFATQIQNIEQQKEKVKAQLQASEHLFQALLKQAFNGGLN